MNGIQEVSGSIPLISTKKVPRTSSSRLIYDFFKRNSGDPDSQFHECVPSTQIRTQFYLYLSNRILDLMEYDFRLTPDAVGVEL